MTLTLVPWVLGAEGRGPVLLAGTGPLRSEMKTSSSTELILEVHLGEHWCPAQEGGRWPLDEQSRQAAGN